MTTQMNTIIITSNEDIIRQLTRRKDPNTRIIDLDHGKQPTSSSHTNDQNISDFALLAELSNLNSTSDHVYKRALDSPQQGPTKSVKVRKKSANMICVICDDNAIGYNYDVPSCGSCKAFFRRNANQNTDQLRCLTGQGQCSVSHGTRRKCQKCRLERCFGKGMRKDFILSEEEKQRRKKRLEENRTLTSERLSIGKSTNVLSDSNPLSISQSFPATTDEVDGLLMNMTGDNGTILFGENDDLNEMGDALLKTLSVEDWITVESIRTSFLSIFENEIVYPSTEATDRTSALIDWSYIASQNGLRFITFCRQIPEFEGFDADDRLILIKYNLFPVYPIMKCFYYNPANDCCSSGDKEEAAKKYRFYTLCFGSNGLPDTLKNLSTALIQLTEQDPTILSLILIILMFSQGLSMNEDEPSLKHPLAVYQAQSSYTRVLCNYMNNKWGEVETRKRFSQLLAVIFQMQLSAKMFRDYIRTQFTTSEAVDKLAPLIQSVLNIS